MMTMMMMMMMMTMVVLMMMVNYDDDDNYDNDADKDDDDQLGSNFSVCVHCKLSHDCKLLGCQWRRNMQSEKVLH
jgi:hypothetical protein